MNYNSRSTHANPVKHIHTSRRLHPITQRATNRLVSFDLTFLDPPFNQGKDYRQHDDSMTDSDYWGWMSEVCKLTLHQSSLGAAMYFMQREKNTEQVLTVLRESGWHFQNLIVWKKMTSAVPSK